MRGNGLFVNRARRRRCLAVVGPLLALTLAGAWQILGAGAAINVSRTGDVRINVNGTLLVTVLGTPGNVPFSGTLDGTVDASGNLNFAQSDIDFPQTPQITIGAATFQITPEATTDWTGTIDPDTGAVVLDGSLNVVAAGILPTQFPACPVGPSTLHLVTGASGLGLVGTPYDKNTGAAMLVDGGFHTPAVPTSPAPDGCSTSTALVNGALGLPNDTGKVVFQVTFEPVLSTGTSTSTSTTSTTVAPTTTTTTVAPMTTTTVAPTTTTVAPTTTTTQASPTTTTLPRAVTSTTVGELGSTTVPTPSTFCDSGCVLPTSTTVAPAGSGGSLPFTGGPVMPLALTGLTLLGAGLGLAVRRRSSV